MDFEALLLRYFDTTDFASVGGERLSSGVERIRVDLGMEQDRGRRFALWALLHTLGNAPDLDVAFKYSADREAARNFMDLADQVEE